jgi:glycosyltransferase involved in cell wall biosynthesis
MKILVISAAFPPMRAGEADHAMHLCQRLAERGFEIHLLTTKRNMATNGIPFKVHPIMPHWLWPDLPRLAKFLKNCAPDAVLLIYSDRDYDCHPMITFASSLSKALLPTVPFVTQMETEYISRQGASIPTRAILKIASGLAGARRLDHVFGTLLSKSDRIIFLSERHLSALSKQFAGLNRKGLVIPPPPLMRMCAEDNRAARRRGREALGLRPADFVIAYYGYVYEEKGIETLFKALQILNAQKRDARLVMIGGNRGENHSSAYLDGLYDLAKQLAIQEKITWTGEYASDSDKASLYLRTADTCVFPFKYGVTLNRSSVAAAAAHGLPIITTKGRTLESAFVDQENLLLCQPEDPDSLASAISLIMDNQALRRRLRQGAQKLAAEHFSWDNALNRTVAALSQ